METWRKPLRRSDEGEPGRVYYLNMALVFNDGTEWTLPSPFTLNPKFGNTIDRMLKGSNYIPKGMRDELFKHRYVEMKHHTGQVVKMWLCEEACPNNWNPEMKQRIREQRTKPLLYDSKGGRLK
jgi:hypothetical protein